MENDLPGGRPAQKNDAALLLDSLQSDRAGLAERLREPRWFTPALGALAAALIASPALPEIFSEGFMLTSLVMAGILVVLGHQRATGVKAPGSRLRESAIMAAAVMATLFFFSVSLGLAASGFHGWIVAPAIAGFLTAAGLARLGVAAVRERVCNVA